VEATGSARDFDSALFELLARFQALRAQIRRAGYAKAEAHGRGPGAGHAPWDQGPGRGKGHGHWGGGFGGQWGGGQRGGGWWPGPPGPDAGPRARKAGRGDVRAAILALLQEGPRTGYQIMSEIDERSGGAWRPSPGAVYPSLAQLADEGLIAGEEAGSRRTFSLTDAGRAYIQEHPEMARGAWESTAQQEAWQVPGLFAEAARLGAGIVQMAHAGTPDQIRAAEKLLEETRRKLYRLLADDVGAEHGAAHKHGPAQDCAAQDGAAQDGAAQDARPADTTAPDES
jgi:DNA-binding PadR family transcriptional regulator